MANPVVHIGYDSAGNVAYVKKYVQEAHDAAGGRQIWLTEVRPCPIEDRCLVDES